MNYKFIENWYKNKAVRFEMIKFLFNRELAVIVPSWEKEDVKKRTTRTLKCHSVQHLDINIDALKMFERKTPYNFYYSLARYKNGIPNQNLKFKSRNNGEWINNHYKEMIGYDYLIDIDAGNFEDVKTWAYDSAKIIKGLFDKYNVPYYLRYSGMGFHFIIPYRFLPELDFNPHLEKNIYTLLIGLSKTLSNNYSEMIDTGIYDSRRVCKIPYSLAIYKDEIYMCCPINSDGEFEDWELKNMKPENWIGKIQGRGEYLFNEDGNLNKLLKLYKV